MVHPPQEPVTDVVVIGGGAAGLAATRRLAVAGFGVVLLEGRDRVGGRVWPCRLGNDIAELGAEFIHGDAAETRELLRAAGTGSIPTADESWTLENGELQQDDRDMEDAAAIFASSAALPADESVDRFLDCAAQDGTPAEALAYARALIEGFDAADPSIASVKAIADEWQSGVNGRSARPLRGYGAVLDQLVADCRNGGAGIRLATVVRAVEWQRGAAAVEYQTPGEEPQTVRARAAIVTLPAGVLRAAGNDVPPLFRPGLPPAKRAALDKLIMGDVVKVTLRFRSRFWAEIAGGRYRDAGFFRCSGQPFPAYWTQAPRRNALVVAWAGGPKATALKRRSSDELTAEALRGFGTLFGDPELARQQFETAAFHDWMDDPFACGAYSYVAVGGSGARTALATPVDGTLFFAGEATSDDGQGGTVNGALQTGERAAGEVQLALARPVQRHA